MRRSVRKLAVALLMTGACTAAIAAPSEARIAFEPCAKSNTMACGHLTVPLDPSGATPGTITLTMKRHRAPVEGSSSAVIALAGGPGQSAIPFTSDFLEMLGPILATRDLIVFDQRGTGLSHPLRCHVFRHPGRRLGLGQAITQCANQLGPSRSDYSTADSVADIEAIRKAGGYEKLVLYGTSYGTKVALQYAQQYPSHVEALILDSVVPASGPDPLRLETLAAVPRVLREMCAFHECAHITDNPVRDLSRALKRMSRHPLAGRYVNGFGHQEKVSIPSQAMLGLLIAGDLNPILRSEFPAAIHSAADGDTAALTRLLAQPEGSTGGAEGIDVPLYYATSCEDQVFPWSRTASPKVRLEEARAKIEGLPKSAIFPFSSTDVLAVSDIPACSFWPYPSPNPPPANDEPLPNVPTLILSGAEDLRTPTANARSVAAQIPDAHVLVVPNTGHAVLGTETTTCARKALLALFAGKAIKRCRPSPPPLFLRPTPVAPTSLRDVSSAAGYRGQSGRTLKAILLTLNYFTHNFIVQLGDEFEAGDIGGPLALHTGGLRAGWAALKRGTISFHHYTYIPGVTLTGTIRSKAVDLNIGGDAAATGTLTLNRKGTLIGTLGARAVQLPAHSSEVLAGGANGLVAHFAPQL